MGEYYFVSDYVIVVITAGSIEEAENILSDTVKNPNMFRLDTDQSSDWND